MAAADPTSLLIAAALTPPLIAAALTPPLIAAQLNHLVAHSTIPIKIEQSWSGGKTPRYSDRFTLLIPYCLDYLKWEVIYTASHPLAAPDILFTEDDDDGNFNPLADGVVMTDWNASDPAALLTLVNEIREAYRLYQMQRVVELGSRFESGVNSAFAREGIEVSVIFGPNRPEEVKFAVPLLDIDLNKLVPCCPWKYQQQIYLEVVFPVSSKSPRLKLVSSSDLNALFSIEDVRLSKWSNGMSMDEYLPPLEENLRVKVAAAVQSLPCRRRFIEALAPKFGRPLEADPVYCRKATVLSVSGNFGFLVHFSLPTQFPVQQPILDLQTCQHINSRGIPVMRQAKPCPWSPRWDTKQMVERIFDFLVDECLDFKTYCSDPAQYR